MPPEFKIPKRRRIEAVVDRKEGAIQSVIARDDPLLGWGDAWCVTAVRSHDRDLLKQGIKSLLSARRP